MRRLFVLLAAFALATGLLAAAASAAQPQHVTRTLTFDVVIPAGEFCDFTYGEQTVLVQNIRRFYDEEGNLVRSERHEEGRIVHQNLDTGQTLTEVIHGAFHVDLVTGELRFTGNYWHLRDEEGRIVLVGSGLFIEDLETGEILKETPKVGADLAETMCPALGGAPAA